MVTRVNSAAVTNTVSGTTSCTATIPAGTGIQAGDLIIVTAGSQTGHTANGISVKDSVNNTAFTTILETELGSASSRWMQTFAFVTPQAIADGSTITVTGYATAANTECSADIFRGATATISRAAAGNSNVSGTSSAAPALGSPPPAGDLVLTFCMAGSGTLTPAAPFTKGSSGTTGASTAIGFVLAADGSSAYGSTWTLGTANTSAAQTVSFAAAAAVSVPLQGARRAGVRNLAPPPPRRYRQALPASQDSPAARVKPRAMVRETPRRAHLTPVVPRQVNPPVPVAEITQRRETWPRPLPRRGRLAQVVPVQANPPYPVAAARQRRRQDPASPRRGRAAAIAPEQAAPSGAQQRHGWFLPLSGRGRAAATVPSTAAAPSPRTVARQAGHWTRRGRITQAPQAQAAPAAPACVPARRAPARAVAFIRRAGRQLMPWAASAPAPFSVGTLTAATTAAATVTAGDSASSALTAGTNPAGTLTAGTTRTGGPG